MKMALVLIIDQSFDSLVHLADLFQANGYECRLASSWKMALDHLLIEAFDIIVCEYCIDGEDAFWFVRHLKTLKISSQYLVVSDDISVKNKIPVERLEVSFCLKPVNWDELCGAINYQP
jgi:DNA-binding NtrC family response regulator